jgi:steroid 5-alpha reductase family enzyme
MFHAMIFTAITISILMLSVWILSVILKDASIVDIVWGLGFVLVSWVLLLSLHEDRPRQWLLTIMVTVWGLRLAGYLAKRNLGHGEDFRYRAMRKKYGPKFPLISLVTVFALQGCLMFVVSLPVQLGQADKSPSVGPLGAMGVMVWIIGLAFEAIGDAQLAKFKRNPDNASKVMNQGLWSLTRHPNYFGDALLWWGIGIVAAESGSGAWGLIGSAAMTYLLMRVSGVPMLEYSLKKRREGYAEYIARTNAFFPGPPKKTV